MKQRNLNTIIFQKNINFHFTKKKKKKKRNLKSFKDIIIYLNLILTFLYSKQS